MAATNRTAKKTIKRVPATTKPLALGDLVDCVEAVARIVKSNDKLFPNGITNLALTVKSSTLLDLAISIQGPGGDGSSLTRSHFDTALRGFILSTADLNLSPNAKQAADELKAKHGALIVFTSGRRNVKEQASAMAGNVVSNRKWIEQTYAKSSERDELQKWVNEHPEAVTQIQLAAGLESIMNQWDAQRQRRISWHLSGDAFDVNPVDDPEGEKIKDTMRTLPNLNKVLFEEGGKVIWHAQFNS